MSNYTETEILSSIDDVNETVMESSIDVFDSIINEFDKLSQFVEFTVFNESVVMEGQVWDTATGAGTLDGTFKKIILFIPRLLIGIVKAIGNVFTKDFKKENDENKSKAAENIEKETDPAKLEVAKENTIVVSEGNLNFDPKKKRFFLTKTFLHIRNYIRILVGVAPLLKKLKNTANGASTSYGTLAKELWAIIRGKAQLGEETAGLTADALIDLSSDACSAALAVRGICSEISLNLEKQMQKDYADGKDITKKAEMKDLADSVASVSKIVSRVTFFGKVVHFLGKDLYKGSFLLRKIRSKLAYDKDEDTAIQDERTKMKELKSRKKAVNRQIAKMEDDQKRIAKKDKALQKYKAKNAKLEQQLADKRLEKDAVEYTGQMNHLDQGFEESAEVDTTNKDVVNEDFGEYNDSVQQSLTDSIKNGVITDKEKEFYKKWDKFFGISNPIEKEEE